MRALGRLASRPWVALGAFNAVMVLWHLPGPFDFAERNQLAHVALMHTSLFVTGVGLWLQIIPSSPLPRRSTASW